MQLKISNFVCPAPFYAHQFMNAIPKGKIGYVRMPKGYKIRCALWLQQNRVSRGTVCLQQGRGECIEKYYELILGFYERGFSIAAFDWLGQGLSDKLSKHHLIGHIDSFDSYVNDYERLCNTFFKHFCPKPWISFGHSMGGCISLQVALNREHVFDKLILTAPMLSLSQPAWLLKSVTCFNPLLRFFNCLELPVSFNVAANLPNSEGFDCSKLTSCADRYKHYQNILTECSNLVLGAPSFQWLFSALKQMKTIAHSEQLSTLNLPVLMFSPQSDHIVNAKKNEALVSKLKLHTIVKLSKAKHEVHMETDEILAQFWQHIDCFLAR